MPLPKQPQINTAETMTPDRLRAIIYGKPGSGKTSLAAGWYPKTTLIIDPEGGTRFLPGEHFIERPKSYSEFTGLIHSLEAEQHGFTAVVIDTIDSLVRLADAEAGQRHGKVAAGLADYGRGLADRDGVLLRDLTRLKNTHLGILLLAHPTTLTDTIAGEEVERLYPRIEAGDRIRQEIIGAFDFTLFMRKEDHTLVTGGAPNIETKRRVALPDELPIPDPVTDPQGGARALYQALVAGVAQLTNTATPIAV